MLWIPYSIWHGSNESGEFMENPDTRFKPLVKQNCEYPYYHPFDQWKIRREMQNGFWNNWDKKYLQRKHNKKQKILKYEFGDQL